MYALKSIEKFLKDKENQLGEDCVNKMLERAIGLSHDGVVNSGDFNEIMENDTLINEYHEIAMIDPDHLKINLSQAFGN